MVQKFKTLADAIALAEFAHRNQVDKAGLPYIDHPRRVLAKVQAQGVLPYVQMAAILHDVTEDTAFTCHMLLGLGIPESAVEIVRLLDRDHSMNYWSAVKSMQNAITFNYSLSMSQADAEKRFSSESLYGGDPQTPEEFYYLGIRSNPMATVVKKADIEDNLSPWGLAYLSEDTRARLEKKYAKALEILG